MEASDAEKQRYWQESQAAIGKIVEDPDFKERFGVEDWDEWNERTDLDFEARKPMLDALGEELAKLGLDPLTYFSN